MMDASFEQIAGQSPCACHVIDNFRLGTARQAMLGGGGGIVSVYWRSRLRGWRIPGLGLCDYHRNQPKGDFG